MTTINSVVQSAATPSHSKPSRLRNRRSASKRFTGLGLALSCMVALGSTAAEAAAPGGARSTALPMSVAEVTTSAAGTTLTVTLPADVKTASFAAKLNGRDVTPRFKLVGAQNRTATLSASDGVRAGKNVLSASARDAQGHAISARLRFETTKASPQGAQPMMNAAAVSVFSLSGPGLLHDTGVNTPFLPPTVSLQTNGDGGWAPGSTWFTLGGTSYPTVTPSGCTDAVYSVMVFDRQTLEDLTGAPEGAGAPRCFSSGADLTAYLKTIPKGQMVIAGTTSLNSLDSGLDATSIGGSKWAGGGAGGAGYLVIGVSGADASTGYESYYVTGGNHTQVNPFAKGTLQEDANGNYNFVSSDVRDYFVVPNAPDNDFHIGATASTITISNGDGSYSAYTPPAGNDGYYLLEVNRGTLATMPNCTPTQTIGNTNYFAGCGTFYPTGTSSHTAAVSEQAYQALAAELAVINSDPWRMAFLTTVERASCCDDSSSVRGPVNGTTYPGNGFLEFANALAPLGGTPSATTYVHGTNSNGPPTFYSLVTAAGIGGPLNGSAVESSSLFSAQGQTGTVHGTLARNNNGLYMPAQASQESTDVLLAKGGTAAVDFKLGEWAAEQPVQWPALSQVLVSQGGATADSISGQLAAYRYISSELLSNHYIKGISSDHLDDIHYFFTGSSNTFIDYHTFDPADLSWPSSCPGDTCTVTVAGKDASFTLNDFNAVKAQTSLEVQYLTNALQFLVTGSTNMKAVVAGGNANVGLALTGAAATILGSSLKPAATTPVHMSWMNIMSMIGSVASVATAIPGLGEVAGIVSASTQVVKDVGSIANALGNASSLCGTFGGAFSSQSANTLPSSYAKFATTIGELANGSLQGQMSAGFDVLSDSITSDWGRLSQLGPMVVDSNNPVFFAQNQAAQNVAVAALTKGAERSFYMSLMPVFYQVHYWPHVQGYMGSKNSVPPMAAMGWQSGQDCDAFYLNPQSGKVVNLADTQATWQRSIGGGSQWSPMPFTQDEGDVDFWVIAGATKGHGSFGASNVPMDADLAATLFSSQGLNIPIDQFVSQYGPMAGSSTWYDASNGDTPQGAGRGSVCDLRDFTDDYGAIENPGAANPELTATATTLTSPETAVLGEDVQLGATVAAGADQVSAGQVYFFVDDAIVATVQLANGGAAFDLKGLALGDHTLKAAYSRVAPYETSTSDATHLTVYSNAPDLSLSASTKALDVSYGTDSAAVDLEVTSKYGIAGPVSFACSGLPVGMACSFSPSSATLAAGGTAKTSLVVTSGPQEGVAILALLLLLGAGGGLLGTCGGARLKSRSARLLLAASALSVASLVGCGSGSTQHNTNPSAFQEKGTKTILVTATVGESTRSVPIEITIK